jgi:RHH-type proline utilization regulon transcriptional repressor/proline dehydrogenase/delta 1-pyrroline-5-carboxylate dehydrogenase
MAYLVRRLLENTSNESFVRHEALDARGREGDVEHLVSRPGPPEGASMSREEPAMPSTPRARIGPAAFENEPLRDFSRSDVRILFQAALERARADAGIHCPVVICGRELETAERILSVSV